MTHNQAKNGVEEVFLPRNVSGDITPDSCDLKGAVSPENSHESPQTDRSSLRPESASSDSVKLPFTPSFQRFSGLFRPAPASIFLRILLGASGLFLIAGFLLASQLEPSPRGYGTHQQLGLPPCSIQYLFGIPCPSCGMTTSFAWFMRGQLILAYQANPAGLYLAILSALLIPWTISSSLRTHVRGAGHLQQWMLILALPCFALAALHWGIRLWL